MSQRASNCLSVGLKLVFLCVTNTSLAWSQTSDTKPKKADAFAEQRQEVEKITVKLNDRSLKLLPGPLYTYEEVLHKWHDGTSWVWGGAGRPSVFLNMMTLRTTRYYEFLSLTSEPLRLDTGYETIWQPVAKWTPKPIPKAPTPAKTKKLRLIQMRSLARRFEARQYQGDNEQRLRRLSQPIHRYPKESKESLDGAIFAFLRLGDLETILVIEASKQEDGSTQWVFNCARVSIDRQEVRLDGNAVWKADKISFSDTFVPRAAYHIFRRPAKEVERANTE